MDRKNELYFEEIGQDFDRFMSLYDVNQRIRLIQKLLPGDDLEVLSCLEVGCGTGKVSAALKPYFRALIVMDLSPKLTEMVAERIGIEGIPGNAMDIPVADNEYDAVISSEMIEHTSSPDKALSELARVVKPGGFLIVTSPNKLWYPVLLLAQKLKLRKFEGNEIWLRPKQASKILREQGMEVLQVGGCHLFPWQVPGSKRILPIIDNYHSQLYPFMLNYGICARKRMN